MKKCAMGRASARTPVPNAVYSTARASACFGGVLSLFSAFGGCRFLSSAEVALQKKIPVRGQGLPFCVE